MMVHQDRKHKVIEMPGGKSLTLQVNRRTKRRRDGPSHDSTQDFTAKVIVQLSRETPRLVISVNRDQLTTGNFLSIPRLALSNVIPSNSAIFQLAKKGNVQDILELVGNGLASFHDRDENGWSLLHVSSAGYPLDALTQLHDC
jgi:hypothetical protein